MSALLCRIPALLVSGCVLAAVGTGVASARMGGADVFRAPEAMYVIGSKRAIGYFQTMGGKCQLTMMIGEVVDPDVGQAPSAARMSLGMAPGESVALGSVEGEQMLATCGAGGETLEIKRSSAVRS